MPEFNYLPDVEYFVQRRCTPEWIIAPQTIDFCDITYIQAGRGVYRINGKPYPVTAGSLLCVPVGSHRQAYTDPVDLMTLSAFNVRLYTPALAPAAPPLPLLSAIEPDARLDSLYRRCARVWMLKEATGALETASLFLEVLGLLLRLTGAAARPAVNPHVQQVSAYIVEHIGEPLSVQALGEALHLHPNYLSRLMRQQTGQPLSRYIATIRINAAEDALQYENVSVKEAALRYGFADIYSFSKAFKRVKGYAPSAAKAGK